MAPPQQYERYTWQDYRSWPEDEQWELIEGGAHAMSPAPATGHQRIAESAGATGVAILGCF